MQRKLIIIVVAVLFIIALVPAIYQPADVSYRKACPGCDTYDQLMALINVSQDVNSQELWLRASTSLEIPYTLPIALPTSADPRAPPS